MNGVATSIPLGAQSAAGINASHVLPIGSGELVGEVSFFTLKGRTADVYGASEGLLGAIMHERLQHLGRAHPELAFQTIKWLGASAISRVAPSVAANAVASQKTLVKTMKGLGSVTQQAQVP